MAARPKAASTQGVLGLPSLTHLLLLWVVSLSACGGAQPQSSFDRPGSPSSVTLEVVNRNFADVQVWVYRLGQRIRVGYVVANQSRVFTIPWRSRAGMQVELDLSSGILCLSDEVLVDPGEELQVEVDQNIERDPDCRRRR